MRKAAAFSAIALSSGKREARIADGGPYPLRKTAAISAIALSSGKRIQRIADGDMRITAAISAIALSFLKRIARHGLALYLPLSRLRAYGGRPALGILGPASFVALVVFIAFGPPPPPVRVGKEGEGGGVVRREIGKGR